MDRDAIERRDFPIGRRGYDQAAVDAHLRQVADELESLRGGAPAAPPPSPLSAGTSEQVRLILEAAEASADEIRADAGRQVADVQRAADGMRARLGDLEGELNRLLDALRTSGERLTEGLARLSEQAGAVPPEEDVAAAGDGSSPPDGASADEAGARLIALNMALSGTPREETARYLAEHFELPDADALLDDVYTRAGE